MWNAFLTLQIQYYLVPLNCGEFQWENKTEWCIISKTERCLLSLKKSDHQIWNKVIIKFLCCSLTSMKTELCINVESMKGVWRRDNIFYLYFQCLGLFTYVMAGTLKFYSTCALVNGQYLWCLHLLPVFQVVKPKSPELSVKQPLIFHF